MSKQKTPVIALSARALNILLPNKMIKNKIAAGSGLSYATVNRWLNDNDPFLTQANILKIIRDETGLTDDIILGEKLPINSKK